MEDRGMATYLFSHYEVNGAPVFERETTITMDENVDVVAHYLMEGQEVSINIRNEEDTEQTVIVRRIVVTETPHTIPVGDSVDIAFNPATDSLVLKTPSA